jgi:hypothetical protein
MSGSTIHFDGPGDYIIQTKEKFNPDSFCMFSFYERTINKSPFTSTYELVLSIRDQSELMGFLNMLYDHHYTLIKVVYDDKFLHKQDEGQRTKQ